MLTDDDILMALEVQYGETEARITVTAIQSMRTRLAKFSDSARSMTGGDVMTITDLAGQLGWLVEETDVSDACQVVFKLDGVTYDVKRVTLETWDDEVGELELLVVELKGHEL